MRATIKNYIDAANRRREEEGEEGFSLIELIIVVVILGILVAIAIPVFANIQSAAEGRALEAAAANGATAGAALIAQGGDPKPDDAAVEAKAKTAAGEGITITSTGDTIDELCVTASGFGKVAKAGPAPGCNAPAAVPAGG